MCGVAQLYVCTRCIGHSMLQDRESSSTRKTLARDRFPHTVYCHQGCREYVLAAYQRLFRYLNHFFRTRVSIFPRDWTAESQGVDVNTKGVRVCAWGGLLWAFRFETWTPGWYCGFTWCGTLSTDRCSAREYSRGGLHLFVSMPLHLFFFTCDLFCLKFTYLLGIIRCIIIYYSWFINEKAFDEMFFIFFT